MSAHLCGEQRADLRAPAHELEEGRAAEAQALHHAVRGHLVVRRGHASLWTNSDTWHSKVVGEMGYLRLFSRTKCSNMNRGAHHNAYYRAHRRRARRRAQQRELAEVVALRVRVDGRAADAHLPCVRAHRDRSLKTNRRFQAKLSKTGPSNCKRIVGSAALSLQK